MAFRHKIYTVAWVCALPLEMAVACAMLEDKPHQGIIQQASDQNVYTLGSVGGHNVVIACLPSGVYGLTSAATVLAEMRQTFPALRLALMVGIGGGVPSQGADIRLGDVVVSIPTATSSGVVQYDYGKATRGGQFKITRHLNNPPSVLLAAISKMRSESMRGKVQLGPIISNTFERHPTLADQCHRPGTDWLFRADYEHETPESEPDCSSCDQANLICREPRGTDEPNVHYGLIASGNQVIKDATRRDKLAAELGIYCFEMEAAGLMDQLPCLVVRGICDYSDSHKHKEWQGYAALAAAVYAKLLLAIVPCQGDGRAGKRLTELTSEGKACMQSLFVGDPSDDINALKRRKGNRAPGTCDWILETEMLQGWLNQTCTEKYEPSSIFWLYGYPGTGKSTMAITIIEELPKHSSFLDGERILVYFLCDSGSENRRKATALLRSVIYQLVTQHLDLIHYVLPKYELLKERLLGSFDTLWSILMDIGQDKASGKKYVIIDALDECDQDSQVTLLTQITQTSHAGPATQEGLGIFFLITSRPYPEIRQLIGDARCQDLSSHRNVRRDLQAFIAERVKVLSWKKKYPPTVTDKVSRILEEKAGGTFLWVGIVCDELSLTRSRDVVKRLEALPQGLHSLYQSLLDSATAHGDDDKQTILLMLSFVAIAQRSLGVAELAEACELYREEDEESRLAFTQEDIEMCRLMLIVQDGYVRLLHTSIKDFLIQSSRLGPMSEPEGHAKLASRCISYFLEVQRYGGELGPRQANSEFLQYAVLHWPDHANAAGPNFTVTPDLEDFFDMAADIWRRWLGLYRQSKPFSMIDGRFSVLHIASRWGILPLVHFALDKAKTDVSTHDSVTDAQEASWYVDGGFRAENGATPMQEAAEHGFVNVMSLLLDNAVIGMTVSEHVLYAAANNERSGKELMSTLLRSPKVKLPLSGRTILAAVRNRKQGPDVLNLVLQQFASQIHITKDLVQAATYNKTSGLQMMNSLLCSGNLQIAQDAMEAICASFDTRTVETMLRASGSESFHLTEDLASALEVNARWGSAVMNLLLNHPKSRLKREAFEHICSTSSAKLVNRAIEKQGKSFEITDAMIRATSRNKHFLDIMRPLLTQRIDSMTTAALEAIYACFPPNIVRLLPASMIELTENSIIAAAANPSGGPGVLMVLLGNQKGPIPSQLLSHICRDFDESTIREILTGQGHGYRITDEMMRAAASKLTGSVGVFKLLLSRRGQQVPVPEAVVAAAAANLSEGPDLIDILLAHNTIPIRITENVMIAAAQNTTNGHMVTRLLLGFDGKSVPTTEGIVRAAAENQPYKCDVVSLLLRGRKDRLTVEAVRAVCELFDAQTVALLLAELGYNWLGSGRRQLPNDREGIQVPITKAVVAAASGHHLGGREVIESLLTQHVVSLTHEAIEDIFRVHDAKIALLVLARPGTSIQITDGMVVAAVENRDSGPSVVSLILQRQDYGIPITLDMVMAAVRNEKSGADIMRILLTQRSHWVSTDVAAAILTYFDARVAASLLRQDTDVIDITEDLVQAAAANRTFGDEVMRVLLRQYDQRIQITPQVIAIAGHNVATGRKILTVLRQYNKVTLTDQVLPTICKYFDAETVKGLLNSFNKHLQITPSLARAAAHNRYDKESVLKLLLEYEESEVFPEALPPIYKHCTVTIMRKLLLRMNLPRPNQESLLTAAACNKYEAPGIVELLLNQSTEHLRLTKAVVKAAVMNPNHGADVLALILQRCRRPLSPRLLAQIFAFASAETIGQLIDQEITSDESINPDIIKALSRNRTHGLGALRLLLKSARTHFDAGAMVIICRDHEANIVELLIDRPEIPTGPTRQLLEASVSNWHIPASLVSRIIDRAWTDDPFPESVLEAAAGNWRHGAETLTLLLNRQLRMPHFTRILIETACDNEQCGHDILRLFIRLDLLQDRRLASDDALFTAATCGQERILDIFSKELGFDIRENLYALAKMYNAALQGDAKLVQALINDGVYPDTPNRRNVTPLWMAAMSGHIEVVRCLLATGRISINRRSVAGRSPIWFASAYGHTEIVDLLLAHNADPSAPDIRGDTATSVAGRYKLT